MTKFFNKVRKNLLQKGKTIGYLKYAMGEIILVVIGILIALQVNNWNENRKGVIRKNHLLKALQEEYTLNLMQLDSVLKYDNLVVTSSLRFLHLDPNDNLLKNKDSLRVLLQNTSWGWTFNPLNGALRSGISAGDIDLIKNEYLKNLLFNWQDVVADAKENEDRALNLRLDSKVIAQHVRNVDYRNSDRIELGTSKFQSDYEGLVTDPNFEDYISDRYSRMKDAIMELNEVRSQNKEILDIIDQELNTQTE